MIYDCNGNLWATPLTIGFRREVQRGSHEPADSVTFTLPDTQIPHWVEQQVSALPYARRRVP